MARLAHPILPGDLRTRLERIGDALIRFGLGDARPSRAASPPRA